MSEDVLKLTPQHLAELNYRQTRIQLYGAMAQIKLQQLELIALKAASDAKQAKGEADAAKKEMERLQGELKEFCGEIEDQYRVDFSSCTWDDVSGVLHVIGTSTKG